MKIAASAAYPSYRVPKLGGQKAGYLEIALRGYRDGTRQHPTMVGQSQSLSDQDIQDLAAYLSSIGTETVEAGGTQGVSYEKAAACAACHGSYLLHALKQYRNGGRGDPVMTAQAALLAEEDLPKLAEYFASLEGLETTKPE